MSCLPNEMVLRSKWDCECILWVTIVEQHYKCCCSVGQLYLTLCNPMDCNPPGFPQTHVHWVSDIIQPFHPLSSPSPPAINLSQHQGLFKWVSSSHPSGGKIIGVSASASVLPMNTQDRFPLGGTGWISLQSKGLSRVFSNTTAQKHQFFGAHLHMLTYDNSFHCFHR